MSEFPATPAQEALWWVHQRAVRKSVYHITWRMGCASPPDLAALDVAWQAVVDRHEALRMALVLGDGGVRTTVAGHVPATVRAVAVDDPGSSPVSSLLARIAEEVHDEPVRLDRPPLARLTVVRVGAEHELLLTAHHSVVDGWGIRLLLTDLSAAYAAAVRGERPVFDTEAASFTAHVRDLFAAREKGRWRKAIDHWKAALDGAAAVTVAPDRPLRAQAGGPGATLRHELSPEAVAGVAAMAKAASTTSFAVVLAAVQAVLARGGAGGDVTVATPAANRMTARDQRVVGYLANLVVARAVVRDDDTMGDLVGRTRDSLWQLLSHQATPYPAVFAELPEATKSALGDMPPVVLTHLGPLTADLSLGDIPLALHRSPNRAARADFTLGYWDGDGGIVVEVEYSADRYERSTALRLLHDLDAVLAVGGEDPGRTVASLPVRTKTVAVERPAPPGDAVGTPAVSREVALAWEQVLGHPPTDADQDFFAGGGGSLKVLQLATAVEAATGARLDLVSWLAEPTPRRIAEQLAGGGDVAPATLVTVREGDGPHLHLVHGAGGSPQDFRELVAALPPDWRVTASQDRAGHDTVPALARTYRADLDAAGLRPDVVGGWSFGGLVAHEMVAAGAAPALLLVDTPPPVGYPREDDAGRLARFADLVAASVDLPPDGSPPVSPRDDALAVRVLAACLAVAGEEVPAWALVERWHAFRRHARAGAAHVSDRVAPAAGVVVGADVTDAELDLWTGRLSGPARLLRVDADHYGVVRAPAVTAVAEAVRDLVAART